jgi:hypothetical protein
MDPSLALEAGLPAVKFTAHKTSSERTVAAKRRAAASARLLGGENMESKLVEELRGLRRLLDALERAK